MGDLLAASLRYNTTTCFILILIDCYSTKDYFVPCADKQFLFALRGCKEEKKKVVAFFLNM